MMSKKLVLFPLGFVVAISTGCAVPQPRGEGQYVHVQEPLTKAWYHLYLPVDYVKNNGRHPNPKLKKWPLVMTFHGMKPYDNALPQEREWEKQADVYGYIVCAPQLESCDSFMEYPLTKEHEYVLTDKRNVLAIMDHVFATTYADPKKVLSTSWSCGGYFAHYFPNRFPDRFSCIATRLSNFSEKLLVEETVPLYRDKIPVAMFIGDGDFPACKYESEEAVAWYQARGFRVVRGKMIDNMGHRRIPQTAAAFFAEHIGIEPLRPLEAAKAVAEVQMTEYYPPQELIARMSPPSGLALAFSARSNNGRGGVVSPVKPPVVPPTTKSEPRGASPPSSSAPPKPTFASATAGRRYPTDRQPTYDPTPQPEQTPAPITKPPAPTPSTKQPQASALDPTGHRVASADRPRNWLEPNKSAQPPTNSRPPTPDKTKRQNVETPKRQNVETSPPSDRHEDVQARSKPAPAQAKPTAKEPVQLAAASRNNNVQFTPQNAGRRDYDRLMEARPREGGYSPPQAAFENVKTPKRQNVKTPNSVTPVSTSAAPRDKAQRVNIRISGPAIGTAPHYLRYSVDLPRDKTIGADFLWMDNGVWMGDDAHGAKILESPGLHFITVLVVTKDESEFRGQAKVQVLERAPTASNYKATGSPG